MFPVLTEQAFSTLKRDPLLDNGAYQVEAQDLSNRIPKAAQRLGDRDWLKDRDCGTLLSTTCARAEYALDLLSLSYSAGVGVQLLKDFFPQVLEYFEEYALYSEAFNSTSEGIRNPGPHIAICDVEFERANRLLCFAILLGNQRTIRNVMALVDYENPKRDGMLERLAARYIERPQSLPNACTRKSPYARTLALFTAPEEERPGRIRDYLGKWYEASRNERYHGTHAGRRFSATGHGKRRRSRSPWTSMIVATGTRSSIPSTWPTLPGRRPAIARWTSMQSLRTACQGW